MKLRNLLIGGKKAGVVVRNSKGGETTLLNTHGKGKKYAAEIRNNQRMTNRGVPKSDKNGEVQKLTKEQLAYRHGYLDCNADHAKAWKSKNGISTGKRGRNNRELMIIK